MDRKCPLRTSAQSSEGRERGETARNVEYIYRELERRGSYITRMGFIFDWIMRVPEEYRARLQPGTGLIFRTPEEWKAIGQIVPIQPHMSDHMIGCPYALENAGWPWRPG